jgi:hypothetical protein
MQHVDNVAKGLAASGMYDLVCYGHNHRIRFSRAGRAVAVNPGPVMGAVFGPAGLIALGAVGAGGDAFGRGLRTRAGTTPTPSCSAISR